MSTVGVKPKVGPRRVSTAKALRYQKAIARLQAHGPGYKLNFMDFAPKCLETEGLFNPPKFERFDVKTPRPTCLHCKKTVSCRESKAKREAATYTKYIECVEQRASFKNPQYIAIKKRLNGQNALQLSRNGTQFHRRCYQLATNSQHLKRDKAKFTTRNTKKVGRKCTKGGTKNKKVVCKADEGRKPFTRSASTPFDSKKCFFCQASTDETEHRTRNSGIHSIVEIVNCSGNQAYLNRLALLQSQGDIGGIVYHGHCKLENYKKYVARESVNVAQVIAETEFVQTVREMTEVGKMVSSVDIEHLYHDKMMKCGAPVAMSRRQLIVWLTTQISNIVIFERRGRLPQLVSSNQTARNAADTLKENIKSLVTAGSIDQKAVMAAKTHFKIADFDGTLQLDSDTIPLELQTLMQQIISGSEEPRTKERQKQMTEKCLKVCNNVIVSTLTDRQVKYEPKATESSFRQMTVSPHQIGVSLWLYHNFRSQRVTNFIFRAGVGVNYSALTTICSRIVGAVRENMRKNGVFIPYGMKRGHFRCSSDNIDKRIQSLDGKASFHALASTLYQQDDNPNQPVHVLGDLFSLPEGGLTSGRETAATGIQILDVQLSRPRTPRYPDYVAGKFDNEYLRACQDDAAWLLTRYCFTQELPVDAAPVIPVWSAYHSLKTSRGPSTLVKDQSFIQPIINAPPQNESTLVTDLHRTCQLNELLNGKDASKVIYAQDMDLYKRTFKIVSGSTLYRSQIELFVGPFHTNICILRCLGNMIRGSGLEMAWQKSELYSSVTTDRILKCSDYRISIDAHEITYEALSYLRLREFFSEHEHVFISISECARNLVTACETNADVPLAVLEMQKTMEEIGLERQLDQFDRDSRCNELHRWCARYLSTCLKFFQHRKAVRDGNVKLYTAALEQVTGIFFELNRHDYARHIPEFVARLSGMSQSDPDIWKRLLKGEFVVQHSDVSFTSVGLDLAQEYQIRKLKSPGAITGITQDEKTLLDFCISAPVLCQLSKDVEDLVGFTDPDSSGVRHDLNDRVSLNRRQKVEKLMATLENQGLFGPREQKLRNIVSNEVVDESRAVKIMEGNASAGESAKEKFIKERLVEAKSGLWDRLPRLPVTTWVKRGKEKQVSIAQLESKNSTGMMSRLLLLLRSTRNVNVPEIIGNFEFAAHSRTLFTIEGDLLPCRDKSTVIPLLEGMAEFEHPRAQEGCGEDEVGQRSSPTVNRSCLVIDGMVVVQQVLDFIEKPFTMENFFKAFVRLVLARSKAYALVIIVFDPYFGGEFDLKEATRERRVGKSAVHPEIFLTNETEISDPKKLLTNIQNKKNTIKFIENEFVNCVQRSYVLVTGHSSRSNRIDYTQPAVSTQPEADTLIFLHAAAAAASGYNITIQSPDTDVFLLAIRRVPLLGVSPKMILGSGELTRTVALEPIYRALGPLRAEALLGWHSLTGCDSGGKMKGVTKEASFKHFISADIPTLTALSELGIGAQPSAETEQKCVLFVSQMKSGKKVKPGDLRWKMFKHLEKDQGLEVLPPTESTWREHVRRAHLQTSIWRQDQEVNPVMHDPCTLGWSRLGNGRIAPTPSENPPAPENLLELCYCRCGMKKRDEEAKCETGHCKCRKEGHPCWEMCLCENELDICMNPNQIPLEF